MVLAVAEQREASDYTRLVSYLLCDFFAEVSDPFARHTLSLLYPFPILSGEM